jgi:nucleotidyltransferase substrate binding protein (TIGR01987 family)
MTKPLIVTSPLAAALAELTKNAALPASAIAREHPELIGTFRTATIKSFEYAFELGIRLLRGRLEIMSSAPAEIEQMEFKRLVRTAAEKGLIDDPLAWVLFREKRSMTSHTYDETKALDVLAVIPQFIERAQFLLARLNGTNDAPR